MMIIIAIIIVIIIAIIMMMMIIFDAMDRLYTKLCYVYVVFSLVLLF